MPKTPNRTPQHLQEDEIRWDLESADPAAAGRMRYVDQGGGQGSFRFYDKDGVFDPRQGGSGITESQHDAFDDLVHDLAENQYIEITRSSGRVSDVVAYTDSGKTTKIRELTNIVRSGGKISSFDVIQYDGSGTEKQRLAYSITRSSGQVSSIDVTETGS